MTTETKTARRVECPSCGRKAKRVSPVTLRALLKHEEAARLLRSGRAAGESKEHSCCDSNGEGYQPINGDTGWRFCDSPDCDAVYFSENGDTTFTKSQLKVPVGVKERDGERPLCYCFGHSVASIKNELRTQGHSDALEDIRARMKDPGCHCETSNPSGSCCLGNVTNGIQIAQKEMGMHVTPAKPSESSTGRGEKITKIGTVVSAIVASSCCWLPLVLLAVGVSGAGIAATLEAYRPLFIVVTFGFLAAAFYFTYRPKKAAEAGHGCCAPDPAAGGDCCAPTGRRRFNLMSFNKAMLWVVTVLAVAFLFFPSYVGLLFGTGNETAVTESMNRAVFKIEGMTCEGCATAVAQAIRQVPGVVTVEVSYQKKRAVVGTDASHPVAQDEILAALKRAGYTGEVVESSEASNGAIDGSAGAAPNDDLEPPKPAGESLSRAIFQIGGMTCDGCTAAVAQSIRSVPGIAGVQVDFRTGQAVVQHPACCQFPQDAVLSAVQKAGFEGRVVESPDDASDAGPDSKE